MNFWIHVFRYEKPVGGVKQMHRLAEALDLLGHKAFWYKIIQPFILTGLQVLLQSLKGRILSATSRPFT